MSEADSGFSHQGIVVLVVVPGDPHSSHLDNPLPAFISLGEGRPKIPVFLGKVLGSVEEIDPASLVPVPTDEALVLFKD